ncbi:MAG TPA: DUF1961 family protein [Armatimonadota bacterium]|nr:DUF1961 family protein [Armatimonadota bacterium]
MARRLTFAAVIIFALLAAGGALAQGGETVAQPEQVLMLEEFGGEWSFDEPDAAHGWWAEGGVRTWVEDGRLYMDTDPEQEGGAPGNCATVWCPQQFAGDISIEFDAHVVRSSTGVNNINFFFHYSDPAGMPLYETREQRADGAYAKYHVLSGNIITYLRDVKAGPEGANLDDLPARVRIRHCPGFELVSETYAYHCNQGVTYHCQIVRQGSRIAFSVDGNLLLEAEDSEAPSGGLIGLRTFRTCLWWDNIKVTQL